MRLYHFLSSEHALTNLSQRHIKIAEFSDLNDPFELVSANSSDSRQRLILRNWKEGFQKKWGILCFSKTWHNPVLWSHYADKHKGMCLGFDVTKEFLLPVKYSANRIDVDFVELLNRDALNVKFMERLLRTKFIDWKYEREVRVSIGLEKKDKGSGLYFYDFSDDIRLAEVIAGPLCCESEDAISDALGKEGSAVRIIKARLAFKTFKVVENRRGFAKRMDA